MKIINASVEVLDQINGDEILKHIEVVGRTCYKSEDKITPNSSKKFVADLIKRGHCFDTKTEILTLKGWKKYNQINDEDLFATLSPQGKLEYLPKIGYTCYNYTGDMIQVESPLVDLLVTEKHKLYACKTTTLKGRKKLDYSLIEANDLYNSGISHAYIKNCNENNAIGVNIHEYILKLLGFSIGDANIYHKTLSFHITKQRKIDYLISIFENTNINYHHDIKNNKIVIHLTDPNLKEYESYFLDIYNIDKEKRIPHILLQNMNKNESISLLDGMLNSDGSLTTDNSYWFCTTSLELKEQFQQLCLHSGFSSNKMSDFDLKEYDNSFHSQKVLTKYSVIKRYNKPEINIGKSSVGKITKVNNWEGIIWCVEVPPYNTIYVRRNGKPVWCGNCAMIEHFNISVKFICDRGVTHEIVRHRIASYAQESTRYCNYNQEKFGKEITVIKPLFWNEESKQFQSWRIGCLQAEITYFELLALGASPQEARSVLPNSLKTEIVVTMNLRELRHFFRLRTAKTAHPQMREVAIMLLEELRGKIPVIFDDIEVK